MTLITDETASPTDVARGLEERGFESMFLGEHTHMPADLKTVYPGERAELPPGVNRMFDPYAALMVASTCTSKLRLGTSICELAVYDPIILAKVIATIDHLSGGRMVLGFGYGWSAQELADHDVEFADRRDILHEKITAMTAIWTQDVASHDGKFVKFDRICSWPKPRQSPRPPVFLGASGPKAIAAVVRYADGWMPTGYESFVSGVPLLRDACDAAGRDMDSVRVTVIDRHVDKQRAEFYARSGVERVIVSKVMTQMLPQNLEAELDAVAINVSPYLSP
jgi:probable F420-dependent oxidoreductase